MGKRSLISYGNSWAIDKAIAATYHHWCGYPDQLGKTLFDLLRDRTLGTPAQTVKRLIKQEPVGWSNIVGKDWSLAPGWNPRIDDPAPQSYTARGDKPNGKITVFEDWSQSYLYHIDLKHHLLHIYQRNESNLEVVSYTHLITLDWIQDTPDWEAIASGKFE